MNLGNRKVVTSGIMALAMMITTAFAGNTQQAAAADTNQNVTETIQCSEDFAYVETELTEVIDAKIKKEQAIAQDQDTVIATVEAYRAEMVMAAQSPWANRVMANVAEFANIRETADEASAIVGKLYKGAAADILERGDVWTRISSGSVQGFVNNEYLAFEQDAEAVANRDGKLTATVNTQTLRVRKEPSETAGVFELAAAGQTYTATANDGQWVTVQLSSGNTGYIASAYASVELVLGKAISIEEEQAAIRAAEEKAAAEAAAKAAAEAKAAVAAKNKSVATTTQAATSASYDDVTLMAGIIQMEAGGESYEGKLAVANVILNRVRSGRYPNTISGVIYQSGQFSTVGRLSGVIAKGVSSACVQAANDALAGTNNVGGYLHFRTVSSANLGSYSSYTIIGNHVFH